MRSELGGPRSFKILVELNFPFISELELDEVFPSKARNKQESLSIHRTILLVTVLIARPQIVSTSLCNIHKPYPPLFSF